MEMGARMTDLSCEYRNDQHGERIYVSLGAPRGESWVIKRDKVLGISIEPIGMSRIPRCEAIEERMRDGGKWPPPKDLA